MKMDDSTTLAPPAATVPVGTNEVVYQQLGLSLIHI